MTNRAKWTCVLGLAVAVSAAACKKGDEKTADKAPAGDTAAQAGGAAGGQPAGGDTATAGGDTATAGGDTAPGGDTAAAGQTAVAEVKPASGSKVTGTVTFTEKDGKVEVAVDLQNVPPGEHGFHVHEKGDCSAPDATSAGGHFNPGNDPHGSPDDPAAKHHAGDLGNITAGADGAVKTTKTVDFLTVGEGERSVVGRAVVVHEKADDLKSQPTGDAGGRIGCGVIEKK